MGEVTSVGFKYPPGYWMHDIDLKHEAVMLIYNFCLCICTRVLWEWQSSKMYKEPEKVAS